MTAVPAVLLALVFARVAAAVDPVPAPLSSVPSPSLENTGAPARALPPTVTICRAGTTTRCWVRKGEDSCSPDGEPFRVVPDRGGDLEQALGACRTPAEPRPTDDAH